MNYPDLVGSLVELRPISPEYYDDYIAMFSPTIAHILHVDSVQTEKEYIQERYRQMQQGNGCMYCIFDKSKHVLIGAIALRETVAGQLYSWINEHYWGGGRYQEALALLFAWYFTNSAQSYVTAQVDVSNMRSYKALKKAGFADMGYSPGPYGKQFELVIRNKKMPRL